MKLNKIICAILCVLMLCGVMAACSKVDPNYGVSSEVTTGENNEYKDVKIPEIKSEDEVMPMYFDISLFDEENYSDIYLGKKFQYKATYSGSELTVPSSYKEMLKEGWSLVKSEGYNADSQIFAGKSLETVFQNEYGKQITAVFFNASKSSVSLKKCAIVKFRVEGNSLVSNSPEHGQFWVNGVNNNSAITDVIECLGAPSHFSSITPNNYIIDYFITPKDRRSGITLWIDIESDCITAIEFSYY